MDFFAHIGHLFFQAVEKFFDLFFTHRPLFAGAPKSTLQFSTVITFTGVVFLMIIKFVFSTRSNVVKRCSHFMHSQQQRISFFRGYHVSPRPTFLRVCILDRAWGRWSLSEILIVDSVYRQRFIYACPAAWCALCDCFLQWLLEATAGVPSLSLRHNDPSFLLCNLLPQPLWLLQA